MTLEGKPLVNFNHPELRPFNKEELKRILKVGLCLKCHSEDTPVFTKWKSDLKCPKVKVHELELLRDF